jgi:broad specificity phosphatase PhoE
MKPKNIVLVRHGQSEGNVNKEIYKTKPDYALRLTPTGVEQATEAGIILANRLGIKTLPQFYISPFWRTRDTYYYIRKAWGLSSHQDLFLNFYEDPRLREQEWHGSLPVDGYALDAENERDAFGHFYYRFDGGESCADVFDRVSDFMNTLNRDFEKPQFPENCVIVTHGMTLRVFLMRWCHLTVEEFEKLANPKNCELVTLQLDEATNKYRLISDLRKHTLRHNYQYVWPDENQSGQSSNQP